MSATPDPRLQKLLGGEALAALRRRLRRHFEREDPDAASGVLRVSGLSGAEHEAIALLIGASPRRTKSLRIDLARLDATLREAGVAASLREALERLDGPIVHRATARAEMQARWSAAIADCEHDALRRLLDAPAVLGLLKRLARQDTDEARRLIAGAQAVLHRLPAQGVPRAQLAAETLGDAHALDSGRGAAALVLAAWRRNETRAAETGGDRAASTVDVSDDPSIESPEERTRDVWARAGVLVNELARPALFLNLPLRGIEAWLGIRGEPGYASLRQLLRAPPAFEVADREVFVCENPNVVAIAADRLGIRCAPLVCTDGMPAAAQRTLLAQLADAGARLRYHGDFDWAGVRIANQVMRTSGAQPWRLRTVDYETAASTAPHAKRNLEDTTVTASWDEALVPAMLRRGFAIAEEAVAETLLEDLHSHFAAKGCVFRA